MGRLDTMPNVQHSQAVDLLASRLKPEARVTVLTGAGVSAASGVAAVATTSP